MSAFTLETVAGAARQFGRVKYYSKGYYSTCNPTREDDNPSLIFGLGTNGRIWFKDYATEADPPAILRCWGLNPETLETEARPADQAQQQPKRRSNRLKFDRTRPAAVYNYNQADGQPAYQVRRFEYTGADGQPAKTFLQYSWIDGRWQAGRAAGPELLYNLQKVIRADLVLIVEGEKDADNLNALGYIATTHAGGAKTVDKALAAYKETLTGKAVIILPDNDEAGQIMASGLAAGLPWAKVVDPALFGGNKADISDLISRLKSELLSTEEIRGEIDQILDQARPAGPAAPAQPSEPGPKALARLAERERFLTAGQQRRQEKQAAKEAQQAERERRFAAGDMGLFCFLGDEEFSPDEIEYKRAQFTSARKWRAYCEKHFPDLDADLQYQIKLEENREARPAKCGEYRKMTAPNGQVVTRRWTCGVCDRCLKNGIRTYRRALNEIQGIGTDRPDAELLPEARKPREIFCTEFGGLPTYKGRPYIQADTSKMIPPADEDLTDFSRYLDGYYPPEIDQADNAPRENAPPLPKVKGDLSLMTIRGDKERLQLARQLRADGINYKSFPIMLDDGPAYDFIVNDDRGEPLGLAATDHRIALWVKGVEGKRAIGPNRRSTAGASGPLLPSLKELQERYREALPFEVVMPELDDSGQPVDPDIFALELHDIGTDKRLPEVTTEIEVTDAESLQAALDEIHEKQLKILSRRRHVNYGVYVFKKFYTRYSTLPALIASFNAEQDKIRQKRRQK